MQTIYARNPIAYAGTLTGLRISSVDGTAFIDNAGAVVPTLADGLHSIEIYDSANRMLRGVLKAGGGGETLGTSLISNPGFADTSGWTAEASCTIASVGGGESGGCLEVTRVSGDYQSTYQITTPVAGALYNSSINVKSGTSGNEAYRGLVQTVTGGIVSVEFAGTSSGIWTKSSDVYLNNIERYYIIKNTATAGTMLFDTAVCQQVLTPSTSGATIVSAKAGTTYNFTSKDASFTYNAASYYCVVRLLR